MSEKNSTPADMYFIRLSDNKSAFLHYEGESKEDTDKVSYRIKESVEGACIFRKENAQNFIRESGASNLEAVPVSEILGE